jgi:hypothetical protein
LISEEDVVLAVLVELQALHASEHSHTISMGDRLGATS